MSTIKYIGKICIVICLLCTMLLPITAYAANSYLVTLLLVPDKSFEYTDYDSAYLTIVNNHTGQSYSFTLYPYNNFSNKVWLESGSYSVLDVGIKGRSDIVFESESEDIIVDRSTAIIVNFSDSKIIKQNTTTTTTEAAPTTTTVSKSTEPEISTLFPVVTNESSTSAALSTTALSSISSETTTLAESTTLKSDNFTKEHPYMISAITIAIMAVIICVVFFVALHKKNKAEE